ncbi:UNKNOWN [Stylonychia lemnae]|uniref:Uncharacterized protein n=1 Tax=Stylonychia lemnae TaxID=5949 RepID=A0A078B876_STYLE|nr:UNKNOWN [Stylonychia lemnae]|eukprot:CDW89492.1 UNKNOWN [Stylonychia lemnae]
MSTYLSGPSRQMMQVQRNILYCQKINYSTKNGQTIDLVDQNTQKQPKAQQKIQFQDDVNELDDFMASLIESKLSSQTLNELLDQLQDDPEDARLLMKVIAKAIEQSDKKEEIIEDLVDIDSILEFMLKKDRLTLKEIGMVHTYLSMYSESEKVISLAVIQVMDSMHRSQFIDIALALQNAVRLENQNLRKKFVKAVDNHIQFINTKLLKGVHLNGVLMIMGGLAANSDIDLSCWPQLEKLLEAEISKRRDPLQKHQCLNLVQLLSQKKIMSQKIWMLVKVIKDTQKYFDLKQMSLADVYIFTLAMKDTPFLTTEVKNHLIEYIVEAGYDDEDLLTILGTNKVTKLINALLYDNYENISSNFLVHLDSFLHHTVEIMNMKKINRVITIMRSMDYFKDKLIMKRAEEQYEKMEQLLQERFPVKNFDRFKGLVEMLDSDDEDEGFEKFRAYGSQNKDGDEVEELKKGFQRKAGAKSAQKPTKPSPRERN